MLLAIEKNELLWLIEIERYRNVSEREEKHVGEGFEE